MVGSKVWEPCNFADSTEKIVLSVWRLGRQACDTPVFAKGGQVIRNQTYCACLSVPGAVAVSFRGSTAESAAARQDLFRLALEPTFVGLSQFCNGSHVSSLCSGHAMVHACHHMSLSKFLKSTAAGGMLHESHSPPQLAAEHQKFSQNGFRSPALSSASSSLHSFQGSSSLALTSSDSSSVTRAHSSTSGW